MKLLILDGNSVINRAYFGVKPDHTGRAVHPRHLRIPQHSGTDGEEGAAEAVCVAFDLHGPTFRHLKYEGYKATVMPCRGTAQQMPIMKDVLRAMNHSHLRMPGLGSRRRDRHRGQDLLSAGLGVRHRHRRPDSLQLIDGNVHVKAGDLQAGAGHDDAV